MGQNASWKGPVLSVGLAALLSVVCGTACSGQAFVTLPGQKASLPRVREMVRAVTVRFSAPPPLLVLGDMKCGPEGNIYGVYSDTPQVVLSQPNGIARLPIEGLSVDDKRVVSYPVPPIPGYQELARSDFDVDAQGRIYALLEARPGKAMETGKLGGDYLIARYNPHGTVASYIKLGGIPGKHAIPGRFAVFGDGSFLIVGVAVEDGRADAFAAIFDHSGKLLSEIPVPSGITSLPYPAPREPVEAVRKRIAAERQVSREFALPAPMVISYSRMIGARDGSVDLLWGTAPPHMYVVSPGGEVIREFDVPPPAPGMKGLQLAALGANRVFVQFSPFPATYSGGSANAGRNTIEVLDRSSGRALAAYQLGPGEDDRALAACATSSNRFLFVRASEDAKNLEVLTYSPDAR